MDKVYVVKEDRYSDCQIEAIFDSEEKAQIYCAINNFVYEIWELGTVEYPGDIEVYQINEACFGLSIENDNKYSLRWVCTDYRLKQEEDKFELWGSKKIPYANTTDGGINITFCTKKKTAKEIEKIAEDKLAKYLEKEI